MARRAWLSMALAVGAVSCGRIGFDPAGVRDAAGTDAAPQPADSGPARTDAGAAPDGAGLDSGPGFGDAGDDAGGSVVPDAAVIPADAGGGTVVRECDVVTLCACTGSETCMLSCPTSDCDFDCSGSSTCAADCSAGAASCTMACSGTSTCVMLCPLDMCVVPPGRTAQCVVDTCTVF